MYIENGDTLVVKSSNEFYNKERSGKKPNTWRYFDYEDGISKREFDYVQYINVVNANNETCKFERVVIDISFFGDVVIISWEHDNGTN